MNKRLFAIVLLVIASAIAPSQAQAQAPLKKITLFGQPSVNNDAIWMANPGRALASRSIGPSISSTTMSTPM